MRLFNRKFSFKKIIAFFLILLTGIIVYYWLFQHGPEVNNNLAKLRTVYKGHTDNVWQANFLGGDSLIASASVDSTVQLWTKDGQLRYSLKHPQGVTHFNLSKNGKFIATSSYDGIVRIWDLQTQKIIHELKGHEGTVWELAYSPNDSLLATAGEDKIICTWNTSTGALIQKLPGHTRNIWALAFTKDGQLASSGFDKTIRIWDLHTGKTIQVLKEQTEAIVSLTVNTDGTLLASGSDDGTICLWQLPGGKLLKKLEGSLHHVYGLAFHPTRNLLLSGHLDKPAIGEVIQNFTGNSKYNKGISVRIWDVASGVLLQTLSEHGNDVNDVAWSNDGKYFVTASEDRTVHVWELLPR